jgi:hypothetical protein
MTGVHRGMMNELGVDRLDEHPFFRLSTPSKEETAVEVTRDRDDC